MWFLFCFATERKWRAINSAALGSRECSVRLFHPIFASDPHPSLHLKWTLQYHTSSLTSLRSGGAEITSLGKMQYGPECSHNLWVSNRQRMREWHLGSESKQIGWKEAPNRSMVKVSLEGKNGSGSSWDIGTQSHHNWGTY